ncbi:class I SAM-dependent methyltransferase [Methanosarcina horonobensis]|uniref:hypothetical protein n=1 Tax=Methanosarcina horonobensis TaxID=418008 RepID=UPI0022B88672|nr:hypothetical protein [Methanosarcina horonobensis]
MSADLSKEVIKKLGVSEDISILNGNHFSLSTGDFITPDVSTRVIMIAAQAEPKEEILAHLLKIAPAGCKISYRIYEKGLMKLLNRDFFA